MVEEKAKGALFFGIENDKAGSIQIAPVGDVGSLQPAQCVKLAGGGAGPRTAMVVGEASASAGSVRKIWFFHPRRKSVGCVGEEGGGVGGRHACPRYGGGQRRVEVDLLRRRVPGACTRFPVGVPPAAAINGLMRPAGLVLMVVVSAGVLTGLNGFFTAASRVLFTLGRANLVSSRLGELNDKERPPRNAILLVCAVCLMTPWFGRAALTWVVDMSSAGITVAYFYTCFCAWKIARTGQVPGMRKPIVPNKFYECFALAGCILSVGFLALLFVPGSPGMQGTASLIVLVVWIVLGLASWAIKSRQLKDVPPEETAALVLGYGAL